MESEKRKMGAFSGKVHRGTATLTGWSDAVFRGQTEEGRYRLACAIGLLHSSRHGPGHLPRRSSKLTPKLVRGILVGDGRAYNGMMGRVTLLLEFYVPLVDVSLVMVGLGVIS